MPSQNSVGPEEGMDIMKAEEAGVPGDRIDGVFGSWAGFGTDQV